MYSNNTVKMTTLKSGKTQIDKPDQFALLRATSLQEENHSIPTDTSRQEDKVSNSRRNN